MSNQVRIIGGKWRSRKLKFPDSEGLRPTLDRFRETLFNWLSFSIHGAVCLDAFAGSGALGFEAISRGAKKVVMLEKANLAFKALEDNVSALDAKEAVLLKTDTLFFLQKTDEQFDIIFLDPPFKDNLLNACLNLIQQKNLLYPLGKIYIEYSNQQIINIPAEFKVIKEILGGQVNIFLLEYTNRG